jgi:hypothetical protein
MDHPEHMKYQAGYPGEDSMREKAERLMRAELMGTPMTLPASHSTPSHEKMRLYKKGGHVKGHHHHEGKEHERAKLHKMQHHGLEMAERGLSKERKLKGGGYAHGGHKHETLQRREDIEAGGHLTNLYIPHEKKLSIQSVKEAEKMHKGGRAHKKHHHHEHMSHGGHPHYGDHEHMAHGGREHHRHHHEHMTPGGHPHYGDHEHMAHGGREHHHKKGHRVHKAAGGTVYEHEMLGARPSTKTPHINYEKDMKGVHCSHHALGKSKGVSANAGAFDASMGEYKKHGGAVKHHSKHHHHTKKMAAGGAAKVRHGVATPSGRPIMRKSPKGY